MTAPGRSLSVVFRRFGPLDRIGIGIGTHEEVYYRCLCDKSDQIGHVFERADSPGVTVAFTHEEFAKLERSPGYSYDRNWFGEAETRARLMGGVDSFAFIPVDERPLIRWREDWCKRFLEKEKAGKTNRRDAPIKAIIPVIQNEMLDAANARVRARRAGEEILIRKAPCYKRLRYWVEVYEAGNKNPLVLRSAYHRSGNTDQRLFDEVELLMARHAARYAVENRITKAALYEDLKADILKQNDVREKAGLPPLPNPSDKTFLKRIGKSLRAFEIDAGRKTRDNACIENAPVSSGLEATRPGQIVEIDEWEVPVVLLLIRAGVWELLNPTQKKAFKKRGKWWLSVALDVASRCVLGMRLAPTPTTETALATLNMALIDKGMFADAVGCLTPWDMSCGIELVLADTGSAYFAHLFHDAVSAIGATIEHPPVGYAPFRGHVERLFGTTHTRLVSRFTGRTFDNTVTLAGYPAERRASLTVEDICWAFVRYFVDCYHNEPHEGLGGETPRNAWKRLVRRYKTVPLPGKDAIRNIFGIPYSAKLDVRGVRILNAYYNSLPLQEYRRTVGDRDVDVMIDRNDLGWVSVKIDGGCLTVPSITPGLIGVCVDDWLSTRADLRRRFGDEAKITENIVLRTLSEIQAMSDAAVKRASIGSTRLSSKQLADAEHRLTIAWSPPAGSAAAAESVSRESGLFSDMIPAPHNTDPNAPVSASAHPVTNNRGSSLNLTMEDD